MLSPIEYQQLCTLNLELWPATADGNLSLLRVRAVRVPCSAAGDKARPRIHGDTIALEGWQNC